VEKCGRSGQDTDDNMALALAGYLRQQMHIQNVKCLLLSHHNNDCTIAPQCHVVRTLPVLLKSVLGAEVARDSCLHGRFRSCMVFTR
jgi:hypothetical protein